MPFKRYVEIGRVALVNYGENYEQALVDAPDMVRSQMSFKRLSLTDIKIDIDVKKKWESSSWGRKFNVQKKRASLNDFDRFKVMLAKIKMAEDVRQEFFLLKEHAARTEIAIRVLKRRKAELEHQAA
ncbi:hypothetical protein C5167_010252 [Papaver somniferum]|uniref:Large ribosomal subunit protein eL14 domain-containing protein n=1 Tax=Papaver somniferum TaxID=3469 RepID=A0A4Y7K3S6_PAPSO|nr:hypothetical protein C5167_010252 [Papaver somniferum]